MAVSTENSNCLTSPKICSRSRALKRSSAKAYYEFEAEAALGLPVHLVAGYKGTADIRLAAEGGEFAGGC
jgi:hypothetical protein